MKNKLFTYKGLETFFVYLEKNFSVFPLKEAKKQKGIILRHDVDFDLLAAYKIAQLERKHHLCSSFFILVSSSAYNPLTQENQYHLKQMAKMGFEIGLHFDPTVYGKLSQKKMAPKVKFEAKILAEIVGKEIKSISLHNPGVTKKFPLFSDFNNAYDPEFFQSDFYLSDSRMIFATDIYEFVKKAPQNQIQLLLHPIHYSLKGDDYPVIISQKITNIISQTDKMFQVNSTYREQLGGRHLKDFLK